MSESYWETVSSNDVALIAARCRRCFKLVARYIADPNGDAPGRWERGRDGCHCDPPPHLPEGGALRALSQRAQRTLTKRAASPVDCVVTVRV